MEGYQSLIVDAVFPTRCLSCGAFGAWCCEDCFAKIERVHRDPCARCGSLTTHECHGNTSPLDALIAFGFYHDPILRELIHSLKYHGATALGGTIATFIAQSVASRNAPWPWAGEASLTLQAVIGSPERVRSRGFDQAEFIRDIVAHELLPWATVSSFLSRSNTSSAQADLPPGPLRHANAQGIFTVTVREVPDAIVLIDDVYTTGATMREAARTLKAAGAKRIYGLALAIGK